MASFVFSTPRNVCEMKWSIGSWPARCLSTRRGTSVPVGVPSTTDLARPLSDQYAIRTRNLQDWNLTRYRCANRPKAKVHEDAVAVRVLNPPKAVPTHLRPVTSWNGRVEISLPEAATPMTHETPQPRWAHSKAARMTSTLPVQSKV